MSDVKTLRILVVDDHPDTVALMARILRNRGHVVQCAHTVADARAATATHHCDLLITDSGLPDSDGVPLMRELKARYGMKGIKRGAIDILRTGLRPALCPSFALVLLFLLCLAGCGHSFPSDDNRSISPRIVAIQKEHDLAIIHVDARVPRVFEWCDISGIKAGVMAASVGETEQVHLSDGLTASRPICFSGRIVAISASGDGTVEIRHDLPVRPGDSGGPLVNTQGKLLGFNSLLLVEWSGKSTGVAVRPNRRWITGVIEGDIR